jgi:hypothetical protein
VVICLKIDVKLERDGHERESCHADVIGALCIAQPPGSAWITHHLQPEFLLGNHRTLRYIEYVLVFTTKVLSHTQLPQFNARCSFGLKSHRVHKDCKSDFCSSRTPQDCYAPGPFASRTAEVAAMAPLGAYPNSAKVGKMAPQHHSDRWTMAAPSTTLTRPKAQRHHGVVAVHHFVHWHDHRHVRRNLYWFSIVSILLLESFGFSYADGIIGVKRGLRRQDIVFRAR